MEAPSYLYLFNGAGGDFPAGVFHSKGEADAFVREYSLSGTLTRYPIGTLIYDYALEKGWFEIKREYQRESDFIQQFSSAYLEHFHYERGKGEGESSKEEERYERGSDDANSQRRGFIYVFVGHNAQFPAGLFHSRMEAERYIKKYSLSGYLTRYPVGVSVYDYMIKTERFRAKSQQQRSPKFVQRFANSASVEYFRYDRGRADDEFPSLDDLLDESENET